MDRLENKIDKIVEQITEINVTMAKNTASLEEHIKRTNLLEEKLEPIEKHVIGVQVVLKVGVTVLGLLAAFAAGHSILH